MKAGWEVKALGEVCEVIAGQSPKSSAYNVTGDGLPFYQGKKDYGERYLNPPTKWTTQITKEAQAGDILMSVRAPVGPLNETSSRICIGRGLAAIRPKVGIAKDYLWYILSALEPTIGGQEGAVFASINKAGIKALPIPLPPLEEQQRIVAVLDAAFEGLARARAHASANLQNARELFDAASLNAFSISGASVPEKKLSEICERITDGTHQTPKYFDEGFVFLSSKNVKGGKLDWDNIKYIDQEQHIAMQKRLSPRRNDVLLRKNGAGYGKAALVDRDVIFDVYVSLAVLRPTEVVLPEYLLHCVNSKIVMKQFMARIKGQGVPNLHLQEIREVVVPVPDDLQVQAEIVRKLNEMLKKSEELGTNYQTKLQDLDDLRQSLLQKAFAGELT